MLITVTFNELELTAMVKKIVDDRLSEILSGMLGRALKEEAEDIDLVKATEVKGKPTAIKPIQPITAPPPQTGYKNKKKNKHKLCSQSDRREMIWLIENTIMSKADIAKRYNVSQGILAPCHFRSSKPWASAKMAPKRPAWYKDRY